MIPESLLEQFRNLPPLRLAVLYDTQRQLALPPIEKMAQRLEMPPNAFVDHYVGAVLPPQGPPAAWISAVIFGDELAGRRWFGLAKKAGAYLIDELGTKPEDWLNPLAYAVEMEDGTVTPAPCKDSLITIFRGDRASLWILFLMTHLRRIPHQFYWVRSKWCSHAEETPKESPYWFACPTAELAVTADLALRRLEAERKAEREAEREAETKIPGASADAKEIWERSAARFHCDSKTQTVAFDSKPVLFKKRGRANGKDDWDPECFRYFAKLIEDGGKAAQNALYKAAFKRRSMGDKWKIELWEQVRRDVNISLKSARAGSVKAESQREASGFDVLQSPE